MSNPTRVTGQLSALPFVALFALALAGTTAKGRGTRLHFRLGQVDRRLQTLSIRAYPSSTLLPIISTLIIVTYQPGTGGAKLEGHCFFS